MSSKSECKCLYSLMSIYQFNSGIINTLRLILRKCHKIENRNFLSIFKNKEYLLTCEDITF